MTALALARASVFPAAAKLAGAKLKADRRGVTALEFGLVGSMALTMMLFVFQIGIYLYIQVSLDFATSLAARQMMTGQGRSNSTTAASFTSQTLCANVVPILDCGQLIVSLSPVGTFSGVTPPLANGPTQAAQTFSTGSAGSLMVMQIVYFAPNFLMGLTPGSSVTFNGASTYPITSTAAYRNES